MTYFFEESTVELDDVRTVCAVEDDLKFAQQLFLIALLIERRPNSLQKRQNHIIHYLKVIILLDVGMYLNCHDLVTLHVSHFVYSAVRSSSDLTHVFQVISCKLIRLKTDCIAW